jgi:hypothetical protein
MSVKNTPENKKLRRLERTLRKGRIPTQINLIDWLTDRGHARTRKEARELIVAGHVLSESHPLGRAVIEEEDDKGETQKYQVFDPFVSSNLRNSIRLKTTTEGG